MDTQMSISLALLLIFIGLCLIIYSLILPRTQYPYPTCSGCDEPLVNGTYAADNGKFYCSRCAEELGLLPCRAKKDELE